jgi:hypothetical protein
VAVSKDGLRYRLVIPGTSVTRAARFSSDLDFREREREAGPAGAGSPPPFSGSLPRIHEQPELTAASRIWARSE